MTKSSKPVDSVNVRVQYFDGLGRPLQIVDWQGSPTKKDIVQHIEYDGFGRDAKKYLPYAEQTSSDGSFKISAITNQGNFYKIGGGWDASVKKTGQPFSVTVFENSPLNRVLEQGSPGSIWQPIANRGTATTTGRTVVSEYGTNVVTTLEGVKLWKVNYANNKLAGASSAGNYAAGKLHKLTIKDENWVSSYGKGGTVDEYKDFEGNLVLKRVWESDTKALNTYYIYDDFGNLCYVLPPAVTSSSFTEKSTDSFFNKYIYGYHYDGRQRLIEKKIPGKGWEWLVYNKNDQEVLRQDSLQRVTKTWTYTKYDAFGRVAYSGLYTNATLTTQALAQTAVNNVPYLWEDRLETANYTDRAFPIIGSTAPHIVNYYDDYTFNGATTSNLQAVGITKSLRTKSFLTGSRITNVDGGAALLTINYYDDKGRLIQSAAQNQLGGTDYVTNTYNFSNELVSSKRDHKPSATGTVTTILTSNSYDHVGRIKQTRKKINTQAEIIQSNMAYNEIGQLKHKDLHASGSTAVQQITYSYNERGWLTSINSPTAISAIKRFGMTLNYGNRERSYNGNIDSIQWSTLVSTGGTQVPVQSYTYSYDNLNRLKKAAYSSTGKVNYYNEELAYDVMGNIDSLRRSKDTTVWFNNFKYTYQGNQLISITDVGSASRNNSFIYDGNGNGTKNTRLGITQIQYNYLNLPKKFVKGSESLQYTYDATGTKLTKTWGTNVTQFINGIQYKNGVIEFIGSEEGRIVPNGSSFTYEYFLKDHLGNTRAVVDHTGAVKQIQDYYAFGMEMNPGNGLTASTNNYKYNGKEKQVELSLDQLDYGARFYDAEIGRWNVIDPLAEKYHNFSPYHYVANNPIIAIDPDGNDIIFVVGDRNYTYRQGNLYINNQIISTVPRTDGRYTFLSNDQQAVLNQYRYIEASGDKVLMGALHTLVNSKNKHFISLGGFGKQSAVDATGSNSQNAQLEYSDGSGSDSEANFNFSASRRRGWSDLELVFHEMRHQLDIDKGKLPSLGGRDEVTRRREQNAVSSQNYVRNKQGKTPLDNYSNKYFYSKESLDDSHKKLLELIQKAMSQSGNSTIYFY